MKSLYILSLLMLLPACQDDGFEQQPVDAGREDSALAICECDMSLAASAVTYDNQTSGLQSVDVQAAMDELALQTPVDIADRISMVSTQQSSSTGTLLVVIAECPADSTVIGGGCVSDGLPSLVLRGAGIANGRYRCKWQSTDGVNETGTAQATCLATE